MLERESGASVGVVSSTVRYTKMEGFHVVIAITQTSINSHLARLFKLYLSEISALDRQDYQVEIKTVTVRLLQSKAFQESWDEDLDEEGDSDGAYTDHPRPRHSRAIVTVHVSSAHLHSWLDEDFGVVRCVELVSRLHTLDMTVGSVDRTKFRARLESYS